MNAAKFFLFTLLLIAIGCGGYKGQSNPRSPEEIQIADLAQELQNQAEQLNSDAEPANPEFGEFAERAARFHNACRRFGSNSLEARNAFDRLYFQYAQINKTQEVAQQSPAWEKISADYVLKIASMLGYKPESGE